jgi:hypothetical protein
MVGRCSRQPGKEAFLLTGLEHAAATFVLGENCRTGRKRSCAVCVLCEAYAIYEVDAARLQFRLVLRQITLHPIPSSCL